MIGISKTHTDILKLILKRFSILILYTYRNDRVTETVIEMTLKTGTEIICLPLPEFLNCLIVCQNARKMHHFEAKNPKKFLTAPSPDPSPIGLSLIHI